MDAVLGVSPGKSQLVWVSAENFDFNIFIISTLSLMYVQNFITIINSLQLRFALVKQRASSTGKFF